MGTLHPLPPSQALLGAVTAAIEAMTWLEPADGAMVALALDYARRIDAATDDKAAGYIGQNLSGVLRALGGAPAERKALGVEEQVAGKLAALRGRRSS
ncbi:terminase small subunit [Trujillonella endophytica]|uniref:Terminase small subunit actinomycetes phage-type domain-containing protein n=1 Tax=Trujillonella endophytica TaxID=673521 RepID=A0A1H8UIP1_9ACTN|nr:hypothetical protein [Trujillella endophytica]SEP02887.1 hypothetical protein SAMN05660991_02939 [Trujillella endophytica]